MWSQKKFISHFIIIEFLSVYLCPKCRLFRKGQLLHIHQKLNFRSLELLFCGILKNMCVDCIYRISQKMESGHLFFLSKVDFRKIVLGCVWSEIENCDKYENKTLKKCHLFYRLYIPENKSMSVLYMKYFIWKKLHII